ncbi:MAG: DUF2341 domain-containing protein [Lentisphaerae bacterium]|nr:DUF2341 domain-containing protein [Lentisphaerota bacterium]
MSGRIIRLFGIAVGLAAWASSAWAVEPIYLDGDQAVVGNYKQWTRFQPILTLDATNCEYAVRFTALENVTVDRALQFMVGTTGGTSLRIGLMADSDGLPSGTWLVSAVTNPPTGDSLEFLGFPSVALTEGTVYHLVTRLETAGGQTVLYGSAIGNDTRPFDGARDTMMNAVLKIYGAAWVVYVNDPFFILGNATYPFGIPGPGQPYTGLYYGGGQPLTLTGSTQAASGQKFVISDKVLPAGSFVTVTEGVFSFAFAGAPTNNLIIKVRDADFDEIGSLTYTTNDAYTIAPTPYATNTFGAPFKLWQGQTYYITPEFEGPRPATSIGYSFLTAVNAANSNYVWCGTMTSWGGTNDCAPIVSGGSGDWSTHALDSTVFRQGSDLYFKLHGAVSNLIVNSPVSNLGRGTATLNGDLRDTNGVPTAASVYYGETDGGTNAASWQHTNDFGFVSAGSLQHPVIGLSDDKSYYYYRFCSSNANGVVWADSTLRFATAIYKPSWNYRAPLAFEGYTKTETLTNFPVLVSVTQFVGFAYGDADPNADDLRFTDENDVQLSYDIELWDTNGASYVWVQVPELTSNAMIWAYWDRGDAVVPSNAVDGSTWANGFAGVWHMSEINAQDSTANGNHGTAVGTPQLGTGIADGAIDFDTGGDYVSVPNQAALDITGTQLTLSMWIRPTSTANKGIIMKGSTTSSQGVYHMSINAGYAQMRLNGSTSEGAGQATTPGGEILANNWYYLAATYDGAKQKIYRNGALSVEQPYSTAISSAAYPLNIGLYYATGYTFPGLMDEVRVDHVARSSNWVWACWMNMGSNTTFSIYGDRELVSKGTVILIR